ncbi:DUF6544 family protein [Spirosoma foliorum]|uniref:Uncharacterized protein n=1 Tax=Spirosoma foliorum TaxID=2710596 RepID=A0A7G5GQ81_9BACT|nr:DUF6544 family protein [Spirosoma foliorum]QMW01023.1 hypothetical protein H3H32_24015 [Spirosoma foliorum]
MLRALFISLLLIHGLIHMLGFVNQWVIALGTQMSEKTIIPLSTGTSKLLGFFWLLTGLCLLWSTVLVWFQNNWWITVTLVCVAFSQVLIILYWPDAKAGTLINVFILFGIGLTNAHNRFEQFADQQAWQLMTPESSDRSVITKPMLTGLPTPVREWLIASGVVGEERIHLVRLRQQGFMRTSPDGQWMPTKAEQYINVDKPGFVWKADVKLLPFLPLAGLDQYINGKGNMRINALSFLPLVNAANSKFDQGELLRYLSEMCWYPSAALSPFITWECFDATSAVATITYKGVTASALFSFDDQYRLISVTAKRYKEADAASRLESWYIPVRGWKIMNGIRIPVKGDVMWKLDAGDFTYYQWEITDIDYNKQMLY